ncbi:4a-hydroxytetrahydrobiopterin dehydratase [Pseudochelatococcus lubricantis]|uniref:4a-hydroxytetrahydrobiopterin dehydratase n=1 Tax=Pseudochelatococcus lubricantis TaxID=1538102 RepID=UPI0035ED7F7E
MTASPLPLTPGQVAGLAETLPLWRVTDDGKAIRRELRFRDFRQAFDFMSAIAAAADEQDHHPDWSNSYNRVAIRLTTHDAGGISARDIRLAEAIDAAAASFGAKPA